MGQHTLLRTMTRKSLMKFGEYHDHTVDQLLQLKKNGYLRWVYYNCENISFDNEVLEMIHIELMQIDKPGKDKRTYNAVRKYFSHFINWKTRKHGEAVNRKIAKANLATLDKMKYESKSYRQGVNHGR